MGKAKGAAKPKKQKTIFRQARLEDAPALVTLRNTATEKLIRDFGQGVWSGTTTEKGVLYTMRHAHVLVACVEKRIVGTLALWTKKPWAIDPAYFKKVKHSLYLTTMAVDANHQRCGIGRALLEEVNEVARKWPAEAIRLDAYEGAGGAGEFYARCGFTEVGRVTYRNVPLIYYERLL